MTTSDDTAFTGAYALHNEVETLVYIEAETGAGREQCYFLVPFADPEGFTHDHSRHPTKFVLMHAPNNNRAVAAAKTFVASASEHGLRKMAFTGCCSCNKCAKLAC